MDSSSYITKALQRSFVPVLMLIVLSMMLSTTGFAQEATDEAPAPETPVTEAATQETVEETETPIETEVPDETSSETPIATEDAPVVEETPPPEVTEDSAPPPDETVVTETPAAEVTPEVAVTEEVVIVTEEAPVATEAPETIEEIPATDVVENQVIESFMEDFTDWTGEGWNVNGWTIATDDDGNNTLNSDLPDASAGILHFEAADFAFSSRVSISEDNTLSLLLRESEAGNIQFVLDSAGNSSLYVNGEMLDSASAPENAVVDGWMTIGVQTSGNIVVLHINGSPVLSDTATTILTGSSARFVTGDANTASVAIDDISLIKSAPEVSIALPVIVEDVVTVETTPDAEMTAEPELAVEVTEEAPAPAEDTAVVTDESIVLSADFEDGMTGWVSGAGIAAAGDANQALLMATGQSINPEADPALSDFSVSGDVLFTADDSSGMSLVSGAYTLNISSTGVVLSIDGQEFGTNDTALAANSWHSFAVTVIGDAVSIVVNDAELFSFSSEAVADSNVLMSANDAMMLDNLVIRDESSVETLATDAPGSDVAVDASMKMSGSLFTIADALQNGDLASAQATIENFNVATDESGRVLVELRAATGYDSSALVALVENIGAEVIQTNETDIEAYVPAEALIALAGADVVQVMLQPSRAVPTGPTAGASSDVFNSTYFSAFDSLGAQAWHTATSPVTGTGIKVGVIDSDFGFATPAATGEYICLAPGNPLLFNPGGAPAGTADAHGLNAVEVICDIAPDADVYLFKAFDESSLGDAIDDAQNGGTAMDVIVITMDLGADVTDGDGTGNGGGSDPYTAIQNARAAGIAVIAAAGNNNLRYVTFQANAATTATIEFSIPQDSAGILKVGWNQPAVSVGTTITHEGGGAAGSNPAVTSGYQVNIGVCTGGQVDGGGRCNYSVAISTSGSAVVQVQLVPDSDGDIDLILQNVDTIPGNEDDYASGTNVLDQTWRTGNLARPADSANVIAVGAVCNDYTTNYAILEHSSKGPKFAPGGDIPTLPVAPIIRSQTKPDIVSVSQVSTSRTIATNCDNGYGGTSAAAANVAGMVALLKSNTTNASMTGATTTAFNAGSGIAVDNLLNYLQTRATDMPFGADADGYDLQFGAGLSVLGSPYYDLSISANTTALPDPDAETGELNDECTAGIVYVGQGNAGGGAQPTGSKALPFQSIGQALNSITADNTCVIVMPGEYPGGIQVNGITNAGVFVKSYDDVTIADNNASIFWLINGFYRTADSIGDDYGSAGLFFENGAVGVTFSGFNFIPVEPHVQTVDSNADEFRSPGGVMFYNSENSVIRDSSFGEITLNSITHSGWNNTRAIPVRVLDGSDGARVFRNTFTNNSTAPGTDGSAVEVINAGANTSDLTRVRIDENTIKGHSNTRSSLDIQNWSAIIWTDNSAVDIVNNKFVENNAETIIQVRTATEGDTLEQRIMGNIFLSNQTTTGDPDEFAAAGPLINAFHARNLYVMSNTFIKNVMDTDSSYAGLVFRGDTISGTRLGSNYQNANNQLFEFHNNLVFFNTINDTARLINDSIQVDEPGFVAYECRDTLQNNDDGFQHNWVYGNNSDPDANTDGVVDNASTHAGVCETARTTNANQNNSTDSPAGQFLGDDPSVVILDTDPLYYALRQTSSIPVEFSDGIDAGDQNINANVTAVYNSLTAIPVDVDGTNLRALNVNIWNPPWVAENDLPMDIGAYEFSPLSIVDDDLDVDAQGPFFEDGGAIQIELLGNDPINNPNVEGGFGQLDFTVDDQAAGSNEFADNFGTQCGLEFTDANRGTILTGTTLRYCPPEHFYTDDGSSTNPDISAIWDDVIRITYTVRDEGGSAATGAIFFTIDPTSDTDINTGQSYIYTAAAGQTTIAVELRPFVRFDNFGINFLQGAEADFPYTYTNPTLANAPLDDNESLYDQAALNTAFGTINEDGTVDLEITPGQTGYLDFTYDVRDVDNNTIATNTVRVRVVSQIPVEGLYDDSGFAFVYTDENDVPRGTWLAKNSDRTINNTYHVSNGLNDKASVTFIGTGFVLYMKAEGLGSDWELRLDDVAVDAPGWTLVGDSDNLVYEASFNSGDIVCSTRTIPSTINPNFLSNRGFVDYTVTCDDTTLTVATREVTAINRTDRRNLAVDAISILNSSTPAANADPLLPGIYDVDQLNIRGLFNIAEWDQESFFFNSQRISYKTINEGTLSSAAEINFSFTGATGFAIETAHLRLAATYTICVTEHATGEGICQDFDNSPLTFTPTVYNALIPFHGYDPSKVYNVEIRDIVVETNGKMVIDSIIVFDDTMLPIAPLREGTTEDSEFEYFVKGPDAASWVFDANSRLASEKTLTEIDRFSKKAGPALMFQIPAAADTIYYNYQSRRRESTQLMICVDRATGTAGVNYGNCLLVNTRPNINLNQLPYQVINSATGVLEDPTANGGGEYDDGDNKRDVIQPVNGLLIIEESMFDRAWDSAGDHTIEIFSLTNETFNLDKVTVLNSTGVLTPGLYEESTANIQYYDSSDTLQNPGLYDRITNPFLTTFTQVSGITTSRDSGGGIIHTSDIGASIYTRIEGYGFAPIFRLERKSDAVNVCWKAGDHTYLTVKNNPDACQIFDNETVFRLHQAKRSISGLPNGIYSIVITMLDDNFDPRGHSTFTLPLEMWFDGIEVYGDDWTGLNELVPLAGDAFYTPNYTNRLTDNNFIYMGSRWANIRGLDSTSLEMGASILFRTNNADAVIIQRNTQIFAGMIVCASPVANPAERNCQEFDNRGATRTVPATFYLNDTGNTAEHTVSITTTGTGRFTLPGIKPVSTGIFQPGLYDDLDASMFYDTSSTQFISNGDMMLENDATVYWASVGNVISNAKTPLNTRKVETGGADSGIESLEFDIKNGESYTLMGVFSFTSNYAGALNMQLVEGNTVLAEIPVADRPDAGETLLLRKKLPVRIDYTSDGDRTVKLRFVSSTAGTFEVDDVFAYTGGDWEIVRNITAYKGYYSRSTIPGARLNFAFTGTGFSLGAVMDSRGGELEVCYDDDATFDEAVETDEDEECFIYQQEIFGIYTDVSRTVIALPLDTYYVRVRDIEDGYRDYLVANDYTVRTGFSKNGQVSIDYLYVYGADDVPITIDNSTVVNEDADINDDGQRELVLLPEDRWGDITGIRASRYSESSYASTVNSRGFPYSREAGSAGAIKLNLDTHSEASVVLFTGVATPFLSSELLVCVDDVNGEIIYNSADRRYELIDSTSCTLIRDANTTSQLVLNPDNLPALGVGGQDKILTFRSLDPSQGVVDGYQVFYGTTLVEGFYEDNLLTGVATYNAAEWETEFFRLYGAGSALFTETNGSGLQFQFTGTGFTLLTQMFRNAGTVDVFVDGTTDFNTTFDLNSTLTIYEAGMTLAGLPEDTYTVTLTPQSDFKFVVDGVHIYGTLSELGSLYDDSQKDVITGDLLLAYGPGSAWKQVSGTLANRSLNKTHHSTGNIGATVTFEVGATTPATGIIIYDTNSFTQDIEICWRDVSSPTTVNCSNENLLVDRTGKVLVAAPAPGNYFVTITNKERRTFILDAIQVLEGTFSEGIYDVDYMNTNGVFQNAGADWSINDILKRASGLNNGSELEFEFTGIGFSIELLESAITAATYNVCIETVASTCNILDDNRVREVGFGTNALTYMGLSQSDGSNGTYTVRLTNTDASDRDIIVTKLHIMGAKDNFTISGTDVVENDDTRIRVLPFGIVETLVDRLQRPSGGSQSRIRLYGATTYFEFQDNSAFEYVRQTSVVSGDVEICYGQINTSPATNMGNTVNCETVENNGSNSYQKAYVVSTGLDCSAPGCWATITSKELRFVMLDYVRLLDLSQPLSEGTYDDTFVALYNFEQTGMSPDTYDTEPGDTVNINVSDKVNLRANGGTVRNYVDLVDGGDDSALYGGMFFQMQGTGFSIGFLGDTKSDAVNICYLLNGTDAEDTINNGVCQTFDNYTQFASTVNRTIIGLPSGDYGVAVQLLPDNGVPAVHRVSELPVGMQIDTVTVYENPFFDNTETNWVSPATTALNVLEPGTVYNFDYTDRVSDNNFQYYGEKWNHRNGSPNFYSEGSYDVVREPGAGVLFRTNGANALIIRSNLSRLYSPVLACATPLSLNPLTPETEPVCQELSMVGVGLAQPIIFQFGSSNTQEYVVSITTLENRFFFVDTLELFNTTAPLTAGTYDNLYPGLFYDNTYTNLVENGNMELDGGWDDIGAVIQVKSAARYEGRFSRQVRADNLEGIASQPFDLVDGEQYTFIARVQVVIGDVRITMPGVTPVDDITLARIPGQWQTYRVDFVADANYNNQVIQFLSEGTSVFYVDNVSVSQGGEWEITRSSLYTDGSYHKSLTPGASMNFAFTGTGFQAGLSIGRTGGEAQICYDDDAVFDESTETGDTQTCFIYQQESIRASREGGRTIVGLPFNTYYVRIRDLEDGSTVTRFRIAEFPRSPLQPGSVWLDFIKIFDDTSVQPVTEPGYYNENATDINGDTYMKLSPDDQWDNIDGRLASRYIESSYYTAISEKTGRRTNQAAGATASLKVNVETGSSTIVVLYTAPFPNRLYSNQLLICADSIEGEVTWDGTDAGLSTPAPATCVLKNDMITQSYVVVDASDLTALGVAGTHTLTFTTLSPGFFDIDAFQVISGDTLTPGIYDDFLPDGLLNFDTSTTSEQDDDRLCNASTAWCSRKTPGNFGKTYVESGERGATLNFNIEGTGFSLISSISALGTDIRICFVPRLSGETIPNDNIAYEGNPDLAQAAPFNYQDVWCDTTTTDTGRLDWGVYNSDRINPFIGRKYGFAYYGMPYGEYRVEIRMIDGTVLTPSRETLRVDAIAVFDDASQLDALTPGFYDDFNNNISYEPAGFWTTVENGLLPTRGPLNGTEHNAKEAGSIVQMNVDGNAMTLYQRLTSFNTADARICLIVTGTAPLCDGEYTDDLEVQLGNFSQATGRDYAVPIMFYGLGQGENVVIIENRQHNRSLNIDAIMIQP